MKLFKSVFLRVCSAVVCMAMMIGVGVGKGEAYDVKDPENCLLHFSVLSDSHIEGNNYMRYKVFAMALQDVRRNRSGSDAVVFLGDNTMNGHRLENMFFHGTVDLLLRNETVLTVMGNHDIGNGEGDYTKLRQRWLDFTAAFYGRDLSAPYYSEIINGYSFIVLGPEAHRVHDMSMSDAQYAFLDDALATAADSGKPAFVFLHFPTSYASDLEPDTTDSLTDTLAAYNREHDLFVFVGHTHMSLRQNRSFRDDHGYPETYLPRLTELGGNTDRELIRDTGVGLEVEVYENEVVLRGRDYYRSEWFVDPRAEDGAPCEMTYALKGSGE